MLKTRAITAVILLALFLPLLFFASFSVLFIALSIVVAIASWEWLRLIWGHQSSLPQFWALTLLASFFVALALIPLDAFLIEQFKLIFTVFLMISAVFWLFIVPFLLKKSLGLSLNQYASFLTFLGIVVFIADWYAMIVLYRKGLGVLLSIFFLVWSADIGAYFSGKALGKHQLAPNLSPGKSIEGVIGGMILVCIFGMACLLAAHDTPHFFGLLAMKLPTYVLFIVMIFLSALSVIGDLFESQLKRLRGVKDSSHLLPGHGGVLDRIDALMPTLPIAALLILGLA